MSWRDVQAVDIACALITAQPLRYGLEVGPRGIAARPMLGAALKRDIESVLHAIPAAPEPEPEPEPPRVRPTFGITPIGFTHPNTPPQERTP